MAERSSRRKLLKGAGAALGAAAAAPLLKRMARAEAQPADARASTRPAAEPFGYCLNTSTIRGANLSITQSIDIAARAGYGAVEPWIGEIQDHEKKGGSIADLAKQIKDHGLEVPSAIGFAKWIVDDDAERAKGLEQMKRDMDLVARIGGTRIAAPPIGANAGDAPVLDLHKVATRYRALLELGDQTGIVPQVELWGPSKNLNRLGEVALVAVEAGHPKACILADIYHMHKGGSDPAGLTLLNGAAMHCLHANDYPAEPARDKITDAHRVYPGDGVAPLDSIFRTLKAIGYRGWLSLELFNKDYWKLSPAKVAQTGIDKLRGAVRKAMG